MNDIVKVATVAKLTEQKLDLIVVSAKRLCKRQNVSCDISKLERDSSTNDTISASIGHLVHHLTMRKSMHIRYLFIVNCKRVNQPTSQEGNQTLLALQHLRKRSHYPCHW